MESSDLSFSEERNQIDEHAYEIGELGKFDVEKSFSDLVGGINDDSSVDFSDQENEVLADELDFGGYSHEAINEYSMSSYSSDDLNEFYGDPSFSAGSYSDEDDYFLSGRPYRQPYYYDDEWDHFVEHEKKHYAPYYQNQEAPISEPAPPTPSPPQPAPAPASQSSSGSATTSSVSSSSVSSVSSTSSSSSSSESAANRYNGLDEDDHLVPKVPK